MATVHDDVEFEGYIENSSGKAWLFRADTWDKGEWVPKSQSEMVPQPNDEQQGHCIMYIRRWLCKKNGWVEE